MQITSSISAVAPGRPRRPLAAPPAFGPINTTTPLWTRHTVGAIEADRDRRIERRTHAPIVYRTMPRVAASVRQADFARERWVDDGGSFDREAAAALLVSTRRG